jgi:hypothetical protein
MVRPACFGYDPETAGSNAFQRRPDAAEAGALAARARAEVEGLAAALESAGVRVALAEDTPEPPKPDACFPNNWFTTHADGTLVLYPMEAASRRLEVRPELVEQVALREGLAIARELDLRAELLPGEFLEGTGSLVLDRPGRVAYACLSSRTSERALARWAELLGYEAVTFRAEDAGGRAVYHTNVCLALGTRLAVCCLEAAAEREQLERRLREGGREVVAIDRAQMAEFCANVLELRGREGGAVWAMSERARRAFRREQLARLEADGQVVAVPAETLETVGGGGVRCTLAELFLPEVA